MTNTTEPRTLIDESLARLILDLYNCIPNDLPMDAPQWMHDKRKEWTRVFTHAAATLSSQEDALKRAEAELANAGAEIAGLRMLIEIGKDDQLGVHYASQSYVNPLNKSANNEECAERYRAWRRWHAKGMRPFLPIGGQHKWKFLIYGIDATNDAWMAATEKERLVMIDAAIDKAMREE